MMQSCASSAKLRGSGPNLHSGFGSHGFKSGHRYLGFIGSLIRAAKPLVLLLHPVVHDAGRKMTPSGTSPLVTRAQRAMSNLRASATIIVLRVLQHVPIIVVHSLHA